MPYKLSAKAQRLLGPLAGDTISVSQILTKIQPLTHLTDLQKKALQYLYKCKDEDRFIHAAEIAKHYGYPNGQYFRGVLTSLEKKGLLVKGEE